MCKTHQSLGLAGGWKMAESWLTSKSTASWTMLGVASCVWPSSVQQRQILDSMSVRYKIHIHKVYNVSLIFLQDTVHQMFCFVQLWNEFGCVKCKAGLCPAYVPPVDIENDQPQDLPPKGRTARPAEGKYPPHRMETHNRVFMWTFHTFTSSAVLEKGWSTCHCPLSLHFSSPHIIWHLLTTNCNSLHQYPLSTTTIHPFYPGDSMLIF